MSRDVDLELLADYAAGTLDSIAAAEIADLIHRDTRWNRAYIALIQADLAVRAELRAVAATDEVIPAALAERLDLVLRSALTVSPHSDVPRQPVPPALAPIGSPAPVGSPAPAGSRAPVGTDGHRPHVATVGSGRRSRRHGLRVAALSAAATVLLAVGVVALLGGGMPTLSTAPGQHVPGSTERDTEVLGTAGARARVFSSGIDYRLDTLAQMLTLAGKGALTLAPSPAAAGSEGSPPSVAGPDTLDVPEPIRGNVAGPLLRLTDPAALRNCLVAVGEAHPGIVVALDFASFNSAPALIVLLRPTDARSPGTVVAVGPRCGLAGADELASASVS